MATITGYFPIPGSTKSSLLTEVWLEGSNMKTVQFPSGGPLPASIASQLVAISENRTDASTSSFDQYHFGPFNVKATGVPTPVPSDRILESPVIKTNNKIFLERMRRGEMVVSNYQRFQAHLSFRNGGVPVTSATLTKTHVTRALGGYGWVKRQFPFGNFNSAYSPSETAHAINGAISVDYAYTTTHDSVTAYAAGFQDSWVQEILDRITATTDEETSLVMETLTEANKASVDILTAMAEMPETIRSGLAGVKAVLNLARDARRKEFRLLERAKRVRTEHSAVMAEINALYKEGRRRAARNRKLLDRLAREKNQRVKQLQADFRRTLKAIADAVTSVWLNYRYNIMPNVYLIQDVIKSLDEQHEVYKRWSKLVHTVYPITQRDGWSISANIPIEIRAFIKRHFEKFSNLSGLLKEYSANIARTLWELVPLSFVVDWFLNVGQILSTLFGSGHNDYKEAATFSLKVDSTINFTHIESGASVHARIKGYRRKVIQPNNYCGLFLQPDVDWKRQLDAISLGWQIFVKNFKFIKHF